MRYFIWFTGLLVASLSVYAELYKCTDTKGNITYKDKPCQSQKQEVMKEKVFRKPASEAPKLQQKSSSKIERNKPSAGGSYTAMGQQGFVERDGVRLAINNSFAVLSKSEGKLNIYLLPSKISPAEKDTLKRGSGVLEFLRKASPDKKRWSWYPYARLVLFNRRGEFSSRNDLNEFHLYTYRFKYEGGNTFMNGSISDRYILGNYSFSGNRVQIQFKGENKGFISKWHLNIDADL